MDQNNHNQVVSVVGKEKSSWKWRICTHKMEIHNELPTLFAIVSPTLFRPSCLQLFAHALECPALALKNYLLLNDKRINPFNTYLSINLWRT